MRGPGGARRRGGAAPVRALRCVRRVSGRRMYAEIHV